MVTGVPELRSDDPLNACYLADASLRAGDLKGALDSLKRATKRFPEFGMAWCDMARLLVELQHVRRATKAAKRAIKLMPDSGVPWGHMGNALAALGKHGRALKCWEKALKLGNPDRSGIQDRIDGLLRKLRGKDGHWRAFQRKGGKTLWAIRVTGCESTVRQGREGEKARKEQRTFKSERAAQRHAERLIADRLRQGFGKLETPPQEEVDPPKKKESARQKKKKSSKTKTAPAPEPKPKPKAPAKRSSRLGKQADKKKPSTRAAKQSDRKPVAKKKASTRSAGKKTTGRVEKAKSGKARTEKAEKTTRKNQASGRLNALRAKAPQPRKSRLRR